jgi:MFS family permease
MSIPHDFLYNPPEFEVSAHTGYKTERIAPLRRLSESNARIFYGWVVIGALLLILAVVLGTRISYGVFFKSIEGEFQLSRFETSAFFSTYMLITCLFAFFGGAALDRYGPRVVLFLMGLCTGASLLLSSRASAPWHLFFSYSLLLAMGTGAGFTIVATTTSRWFLRRRGLAMGIASSGEGLGIGIMAPAAMVCITSYGWRTALVIMGVSAILVMCCMSFLLKKDPAEMGLAPDGVKAPSLQRDPSGTAPALVSITLGGAFRTRSFWCFFIIYFFLSFCFHLVTTHIVPHATDLGIAREKAALILTLIGTISSAGRLIFGALSDRIGRKLSVVLCALLQSAMLVLVAWSRELWIFYVFAILYGFGFGGVSTVTTALVGDTFGAVNLGAIMGAAVVGYALGAAAGPLVGGHVFDLTNDYLIAFLIGAVAILVAVLFVLLIKREAEGLQKA